MVYSLRTVACGLLSTLWLAAAASAAADYVKKDTWRQTLTANLGAGPSQAVARAVKDFPQDRQRLEIVGDWITQDGLDVDGRLHPRAIGRVIDASGSAGSTLRARFDRLVQSNAALADPRWAELYLEACELRRKRRLAPHRDKLARAVFTKHYDLGGSHYAYTEGQSDAQRERHFQPGTALCVLEMDDVYGRVETLVEDPEGVIRDPDVAYDAERILFEWKKGLDTDDYHLYEIHVGDGRIRQITSGLGYADYEAAYLPDGDLVLNSTRCIQTVDCWWTEVSNLFTCDSKGRYLRQLSFDQVHSNYPTVTHDGRVIYTRWDYNDRGQIYPQGLFQMNPDGTGQTELYGNNSFFPTAILHARAIPGTGKIVCVFSGHHTRQNGWLGLLDPGKGRQENLGAQLIAPVRDTPAVHVDRYGQEGDQFQYPYPLDESAFLVALRPEGAERYALYFVTIDGQRELLVSDPKTSCNQPVPLCRRPEPLRRPNLVDYRDDQAAVYLHDVYRGPGLAGVERGTIRGVRVIALEFRAAGIGKNGNRGPAGGAMASTPISIEGAWDVKKVLGTAKVHADGSACFHVPAKTPVYFQAVDGQGQMVQSMRSWVSLQPGETASCVGCHEHKNSSPPVTEASRAMLAGPTELEPFYGPPRGFSFIQEIQPILDKHCVRCHRLDEPPRYSEASSAASLEGADDDQPAFSLRGIQILDLESQRKWSDSYRALADRRVANWINVQSAPPMLPPYHAGASQSRLIHVLRDGSHYGVRLSRPEMDRFVVWIDLLVPYCGDYTEAMNEEHVGDYNQFVQKRRRWHAEEADNVDRYLRDRK
ncbi:MAG: HzsA-related protein [Planctomycetota bacterium]|jgi:hypothetical protein